MASSILCIDVTVILRCYHGIIHTVLKTAKVLSSKSFHIYGICFSPSSSNVPNALLCSNINSCYITSSLPVMMLDSKRQYINFVCIPTAINITCSSLYSHDYEYFNMQSWFNSAWNDHNDIDIYRFYQIFKG